jgi:hypothetical protein
MTATILQPPQKNWQCPACDLQHVTFEARPHTPMHPCASMNGLLAPFVEVTGVELDRKAARLVRVDREDYVGKEIVRTDGVGRPAMAVVTERADGSNDCHVFASTAQAFAQQGE